jgi:hypothetical protein
LAGGGLALRRFADEVDANRGGLHKMPERPGGRTTKDEKAEDIARQSPPERITVALIPKAGDDLQSLQDRTGLSKTDLVNRAITLYEFFDERIRAGHDVLIRDKGTGDTQTVVLL